MPYQTMMKKITLISCLLVASFMFMGCPYSSEVSIDTEASTKINKMLIGKWESKSSSDYSYTVSEKSSNTYVIEKKSASSGDVTTYNGFLSEIDGVKYLNISEESSSTPTYYFYKFDVSTSGNKATLTPVTENITEKFTTSAELKKFFKDNQKNSYFFDKDADVYIKSE